MSAPIRKGKKKEVEAEQQRSQKLKAATKSATNTPSGLATRSKPGIESCLCETNLSEDFRQ